MERINDSLFAAGDDDVSTGLVRSGGFQGRTLGAVSNA
jgi:hypothetical protein